MTLLPVPCFGTSCAIKSFLHRTYYSWKYLSHRQELLFVCLLQDNASKSVRTSTLLFTIGKPRAVPTSGCGLRVDAIGRQNGLVGQCDILILMSLRARARLKPILWSRTDCNVSDLNRSRLRAIWWSRTWRNISDLMRGLKRHSRRRQGEEDQWNDNSLCVCTLFCQTLRGGRRTGTSAAEICLFDNPSQEAELHFVYYLVSPITANQMIQCMSSQPMGG
jgi:hypothetical protein